MEAVALDPEGAGIVQPMRSAVTAPLHSTQAGSRDDKDAHEMRSLFSSQTNVPLLAAPIGAANLHPPVVALSPALLAMLGGLVLLSGIIVGTAVRHLLAPPAPPALVSIPTPVIAPLPPAPAAIVSPAIPVSNPPLPEAPVPVTARVRARPIARHAKETLESVPARPSGPSAKAKVWPAAPKTWIDPWAD